MEKDKEAKTMIYILACIGLFISAFFIEELSTIPGIILAYTTGVAVGYVLWKNDITKD